MSVIQELRLVAAARPNLDDRAAIQESILEIIEDISSIKDQWNDAIYPLLGSLPGQDIVVARAERSQEIDPFANGFDGSQVFVDMTSRPNELGGLLHNGLRPKTIKEAIVETNQSLLARMAAIEALIAAVNAGAAAYDDTEVRDWIKQLAGETWDPDEIAAGSTFNTANFAGSPVKSSPTSLWQRVLNMRHLVGVEGEALTLQDISGLFAGANYISADTDIVTALMTLDAQLFGAVPVAPDLQTAYNNGEAIALAAATPVSVTTNGSSTDDTALQVYGKIDFQDTSSGPGAAAKLRSTYTLGTTLTEFSIYEGGDALLTLPSENDLMLRSLKSGTTSVLSIGKTTATAGEEYGILELGRETVGAGGDPRFKIEDGGGALIQMQAPTAGIEIQSLGANVDIYATTTAIINALASLDLSGGDLTLASTSGNTILNSFAAFDLNAAGNVDIATTTGYARLITTDATANGWFQVRAQGSGSFGADINSNLQVTGDYHHIGLLAGTGVESSVYSQGTNNIMWADESLFFSTDGTSGGGWYFHGTDAAWATGINFVHMTTVISDPTLAGAVDDGLVGDIKYFSGEFADARYELPATASVDGLVCEMAAFKASGYAPHETSVGAYGASLDPYRLYKDNGVMSKGKINVDVSKVSFFDETDVDSLFNLDITTSSAWTGAGGIVQIRFEAALESNAYTVTTGYDSSDVMMFKIQNQTINGFDVECLRFNSAGPSWDQVTSSDNDFTLHFQVV